MMWRNKFRSTSTKKTSGRNQKPEEALQSKIVQWFNYNYPSEKDFLHGNAVAGFFMGTVIKDNGVTIFKKNAKLLKRMKDSGMNENFPDLAILIPKGGYHGFFLEFKTPENSPFLKDGSYSTAKAFKDQLEYGMKLTYRGYFWEFGVGFDKSIELIKNYMAGKIIRDEFPFYIEFEDDRETEIIHSHKLGARVEYLEKMGIKFQIKTPKQYEGL